MGLNGMNLQPRTTTFGNELNFFDSQQRRFIRGGATVDHEKVSAAYQATENNLIRTLVPSGTPYAKLASGKYCPVKSTTLKTTTGAADTTVEFTNAKNFQPGDTITVGATSATIAAAGINYTTNVVTLTAAIGAIENAGVEIKATDGGDAAFLCTDNADVSYGDCAVTGVDDARVITARLPYPITSFIKADLSRITFV